MCNVALLRRSAKCIALQRHTYDRPIMIDSTRNCDNSLHDTLSFRAKLA